MKRILKGGKTGRLKACRTAVSTVCEWVDELWTDNSIKMRRPGGTLFGDADW